MAINVLCPNCKSSYGLGAKSCRKCGNNLQKNRKYRVDVKGKHRTTRTVDTLELAKQLEAKIEQDAIRRDELGIIDPPTFQEVWEAFYENAKANTKTPEYYERFWRNHIGPEFAQRRLNEVKPLDIDVFARQLKAKVHKLSPNAKGKATQHLAPSTISNIIKAMRRLYSFSMKRDLYVGKDPTKSVDLPRYDNRVNNILSDDELSRLLKVLRGWPNRMSALAFFLCLVTGKRTGEIFGLTWSDINFETEMIRFEIKSVRQGEHQYLPMNQLALEILTEARQYRRRGCQLVFHTESGKLISYYATWVRIKNNAGLPDCIRPHDLRHNFASRMASSGKVDIYTLQNILGHKTIAMTRRYAHLMDNAMRRGICAADRIFGRGARRGQPDNDRQDQQDP